MEATLAARAGSDVRHVRRSFGFRSVAQEENVDTAQCPEFVRVFQELGMDIGDVRANGCEALHALKEFPPHVAGLGVGGGLRSFNTATISPTWA
jgi:hypothetical protein